MSEENVEVVRGAVEAFEHDGLEGSLRHVPPRNRVVHHRCMDRGGHLSGTRGRAPLLRPARRRVRRSSLRGGGADRRRPARHRGRARQRSRQDERCHRSRGRCTPSVRCGTAWSGASTTTRTRPKPSKPPGLRSRRCRRRTWRSCDGRLTPSTGATSRRSTRFGLRRGSCTRASPPPTVFRGRQGIRDYFAWLAEAFEEFRSEVEEIIDAGEDRVVALLIASARGKASGVPLDDQRFAIVFTFQGKRIARADSYLTRAEALEAAGLSE